MVADRIARRVKGLAVVAVKRDPGRHLPEWSDLLDSRQGEVVPVLSILQSRPKASSPCAA